MFGAFLAGVFIAAFAVFLYVKVKKSRSEGGGSAGGSGGGAKLK